LTVTPAPFNATTALFDVDGPSGPAVRVTFNSDVDPSTLASNDLRVVDAAGQPTGLSASSVSYDAPSRTAIWSFAGPLPDGQYRAILPAGSVSDSNGERLPQDATVSFFTLGGDANRDRQVNLADFNILASNFGQSSRTFSQADFNYDGTVNLADFNILASKFRQLIAPQTESGAVNRMASTDLRESILAGKGALPRRFSSRMIAALDDLMT
jgi:hypothetical protein